LGKIAAHSEGKKISDDLTKKLYDSKQIDLIIRMAFFRDIE
jgi:hypothetical protein